MPTGAATNWSPACATVPYCCSRGHGRATRFWSEVRDLVKLPYDERRIVVVTERLPTIQAPAAAAPAWQVALKAASFVLPMTVGGLAAGAVVELMTARKEMKKGGEELLPITSEEARSLRFPVGHPRRNVVYIGHPVDPSRYITVANFHQYLFEHKVAEALRLIRSLGARSVEVVHVEGWDQTAGISVGLNAPTAASGATADVGASADKKRARGTHVLTTMTLSPTREPHIPENLVWLAHEPLWQEVASARLESGLDTFLIDVRSSDDYGVNASLKALVAKVGLEAGGNFVEHRNTVWRLQGSF